MRPTASLLVLIALCGCRKPMPAVEALHSFHALYSAFDAAGAPQLRTGLWVGVDPKCAVTESASAGTWPACAEWMVVRPKQVITHPAGLTSDKLGTSAYLLAEGYPRILQQTASPPPPPNYFWYEGLRPLGLDGGGRIIRARIWDAECDEPAVSATSSAPSDAPPNSGALSASSNPGPFVDHCYVTSRGEVRAAIIAAEKPRDESNVFHWVRDEEH